MIAMYDLFDNYIMSFDSVKECAKYFNTTPKYIHYYFSRMRHGNHQKKWDKDRWVKLYIIKDDEN